MPIVISTLACLRGTSAMRCCAGFFMGTVCSSFGGPAHPIYLFNLSGIEASALKSSLKSRIGGNASDVRKFSGDSVKPMTPVYVELSGSDLRIKWTEEHTEINLDDLGEPVRKPQKKN